MSNHDLLGAQYLDSSARLTALDGGGPSSILASTGAGFIGSSTAHVAAITFTFPLVMVSTARFGHQYWHLICDRSQCRQPPEE